MISDNTEVVAQLVRASDCGSEGRGFETHQSPGNLVDAAFTGFFLLKELKKKQSTLFQKIF